MHKCRARQMMVQPGRNLIYTSAASKKKMSVAASAACAADLPSSHHTIQCRELSKTSWMTFDMGDHEASAAIKSKATCKQFHHLCSLGSSPSLIYVSESLHTERHLEVGAASWVVCV